MKGTLTASMLALALAAQTAHGQAPAPNPAADAALAEGRRLYDLQEWDKAIAKFKEAYTLREDAPALFNIAQSYRLKGDCTQAASFYKTFKRKFPKEKNIAKVDKFITEMETCAKTAKPVEPTTTPTPTPTTTTPPTTTPPTTTTPTTTTPPRQPDPIVGPVDKPAAAPGGLRIASYVSLGAGGAALIVGGIFAVKARGAANEAEGLAMGDMWIPGIEERGRRNQKTATFAFIAGGGLVAAGAVMFWLSRPTSEERNTVSIVPTDEGAQFVWAGSF